MSRFLSAVVLKRSPEYVIRSLPTIETTGLPVIIVWTQISTITKTFCFVFATVALGLLKGKERLAKTETELCFCASPNILLGNLK